MTERGVRSTVALLDKAIPGSSDWESEVDEIMIYREAERVTLDSLDPNHHPLVKKPSRRLRTGHTASVQE